MSNEDTPVFATNPTFSDTPTGNAEVSVAGTTEPTLSRAENSEAKLSTSSSLREESIKGYILETNTLYLSRNSSVEMVAALSCTL